MKKTRIAVAGAGSIGRAHIKRILEDPQTDLACIIDPAPQAKELAASLRVSKFDDLAIALAETKADGVILATPNTAHVPGGLAAVEARVPMLVEKPISSDVASARTLVEAAERAGVPILVGHHRRHSAHIRKAKEILESGRLGHIAAVNAVCLYRKPDSGYFDGAGSWRREPGGGVMLINLIHTVDDLRNLCGEIVGVQAAGSKMIRKFPVEDTAAALLHFENGALGTIVISDTVAAPWSWEMTSGEDKAYPHTDQSCYFIGGTKGALAIPSLDLWSYEAEPHWNKPIQATRVHAPPEDPLVVQLRHFCEVVRGEAKPKLDGRGGIRTLETTLAVKRAADTKTTVEIS